MKVTTMRESASINPDGVVVPEGTSGEICGEGYSNEHGVEYVAVDFGNLVCDLPLADLRILRSPFGKGSRR